ncbi:NACHT domain-containing protein [Streptomyces europaeiscabiei]|uniref:NACHT domain-containing protein n=1 Tax=Streptomyces europaeiscabiei TaxID=146819 RepID=UPI00131CF238|nr:NACHT domain-containing protein [Streptomyces europaeiscabiei]
MVVIGRPGAGKSTLALLLTWELLNSWEPGEPVPILLSLSSWRSSDSLSDWVVRNLKNFRYSLHKNRILGEGVERKLFDEGQVMPVLDGLDEVPEAVRGQVVNAIEDAIVSDKGLLMTCRSDEYEALAREGQRLSRAAVVELDPVSTESAERFLQQTLEESDNRWDTVFQSLQENPYSPLAQVLSSPLMLYLARIAYQSRSTNPDELLELPRFGKSEDIEDHLLESYLDTVYRESRSRYRSARARRYLEVIARQMQSDRTHEFAWWQIDSWVTSIFVGLAYGVSCGWLGYMMLGQIGIFFGAFMGSLSSVLAHLIFHDPLRNIYVAEGFARRPETLKVRSVGLALLTASVSFFVMMGLVGGWLWLAFDVDGRRATLIAAISGGIVGVATLVGSAWASYRISHLWFLLRGQLPLRFTRFIRYSHDLGVLRRSGVAYQFRHERLHVKLSGHQWEANRSVYRKTNHAGFKKIALHLTPFIAQAAVLSFTLLYITVVAYGSNASDYLKVEAGAKAELESFSFCPQPQACPPNNPNLTWNLPPGADLKSDLTPSSNEDGVVYTKIGGIINVFNCRGAVVEVSITRRGRIMDHFTVKGSQKSVDLGERTIISSPIRLVGGISIALRRLDNVSCAAQFQWGNEFIVKDSLELLKTQFLQRSSRLGL